MIIALSVIGAVVAVVLAVVSWWPGRPRRRRDHDWGDWPPDQMAR